MKNSIIALSSFVSSFRKFKKKFPSLTESLATLEIELQENPQLGESLGANLYKIRLANADKNKGKSAGFRVITYLVQEEKDHHTIYLLKIYDKSEEATIKKPILLKLVESYFK